MSSIACPTCAKPLPPDGVCPTCAATIVGGPVEADPGFTGPKQVAGYRILRELGAGGMGTVYEAHDVKMNRKVALKVMSRHHAPSEKSALRFEQEAWIAGKLEHPNIVKVYERGEWEELSYFSMELVDGGSLYDVVSNMKRWGRDDRWHLELGTREYVHWAINQIIAAARGLDYAHRQGVVHRDVKPMNLLLSRELGAVKLADFGLAIEAEATRMTTAGKILGTLLYMAPEQILGKQDQIDRRTDVYALGVTLFELLTLKMPYRGETQQVYMNAVLTTDARRPSKLNDRISPDLETVIRKALEKRRRDRYDSAADFADDLENVINLRPIQAQRSSWFKKTSKWVQRKPIHAALLATLIVAVPTVSLLSLREFQHRRVERQETVAALVEDARWLEGRRDFAELFNRAEEILRLDTDNPEGLTFRAISRAKLALVADDSSSEALKAGALEDTLRLVELEPKGSYSHRLRAHVLRQLEHDIEAEAEEVLALQFRGEIVSDRELGLDARLALNGEKYKEAIDKYTDLIARTPGDALAISSRGMAYDYLDQFSKAYMEYRIALAVNPTLNKIYIDIGRLAVNHLNDLDEAKGFLEMARELNPDSPHAHEAWSHYLIERGLSVKSNDRSSAVEFFDQAEAAARKSIELLEDQPAESGEALAQKKERAYAYANLGSALIERYRVLDEPEPKSLDEIDEIYKTILDLWDKPPENPDELGAYQNASINRCDLKIEIGRLEEALEACTSVTELTPDNPVAFYNLAGVHALSGRQEEALAALRKDLKLGDTDWQYLVDDRWFAKLRDDPEFRRIVEAMKRAAAEKERSSSM